MFFYSTYPDLFFYYNESNPIRYVPKAFHDALHPNISDDPLASFFAVPFAVQMVMSAVCLFIYFGLINFYVQKFLSNAFQYFLIFMSSAFAPLFLNYSLNCTMFCLLAFFKSSNVEKWYILFQPLFAISSFPALIIVIVKGFADIRINSLPMTSSDPALASMWFAGTLLFTSVETIFYSVDEDDRMAQTIICVFLTLLSLAMTFYSFHRAFFFSQLSKMICSSISLNCLTSSFIMIIQIRKSDSNLPYAIIALDFIGILISIGYHFYIGTKINLSVLEEEFKFNEISQRDIYRIYSYCSKANRDLFVNLDHMKFIKTEYDDADLVLLSARYIHMRSDYNPSAVFEYCVYYLKFTYHKFFNSLMYSIIIDMAASLLKRNEKHNFIRQQLLDEMVDSCINSHLQFWRAVIQESIVDIAESGSRLYYKVKNTQKFFKQLKVDVKRTDHLGVRYVDFLMNVTADLVPLSELTFEASRPVPYDERFKMHNPRRDSISVEKFNWPFVEINDDNNAESQNDNLGKVQKIKLQRVKKLISEDRIELAEAVDKTELPYSTARKNILISTYSIIFLLYLAIFIAVVYIYWFLRAFEKRSSSLFEGQLSFAKASYSVISYITYDIYKEHNIFSERYETNETVYNTILSSAKELNKNSRIKKIIPQSSIDSFFVQIKNLAEMTFDNSSQLGLNSEFTSFVSLYTTIVSDTIAGFKKTVREIDDADDFIRETYRIIHIASTVVFVIGLVCVIVTIFYTYQSMNYLFWQTLMIDKAEVAEVFHTFMHVKSVDRRKSSRSLIQSSVKKNAKTGFYFVAYRIICFVKIPIMFVIMYFVMMAFSMILKECVEYKSNCAKAVINSGILSSLYSTSMYQFILITENNTKSYQYIPWIRMAYKSFYTAFSSFNTTKYTDNNPFDPFLPNDTNETAFDLDIKPIHQLPLYPLPNATTNSRFELVTSQIIMMYLDLSTSFNKTGFAAMKIEYLFHFAVTIRYWAIQSQENYENKTQLMTTVFDIVYVVYLIAICYCLYFGITGIIDLKEMCQLFIRIITLLPSSTPFFEKGEYPEIKFYSKKPESNTQMIIDTLPIAFIITDKRDRVIQVNKQASYFFGNNLMARHIDDLEPPPMRFYIRDSYLVSEFPYHPFDHQFKGNMYHIFHDKSKIKLQEAEIEMIENQLMDFRKALLPPVILSSKRIKTQNILLISKYAIVEVAFPDTMLKEDFISVRTMVQNSISTLSTLFIADLSRQSFFIIFGSFNVHYHQRQFIRDAVKIGHMILEQFTQYESVSGSKLSISNGEKCICRIVDNETIHLSLFPFVLNKSSVLLKYAGPNQAIIETMLIKSIRRTEEISGIPGIASVSGYEVDYIILDALPV